MKTICEKGEDNVCNGGCRTSALLPETDVRVGGGGANGTMSEVAGGRKSMKIVQEEECKSSSSSSIGDNSDSDPEEDIESRYAYDHHNNNGSFDDAIQALEEALPIRRGISTFYNGKSKSFTSLTDEWPSTSSIQEIAKPENAYTRKRRNLGAFNLSDINTTERISKKPKITQIDRPLSLRSFSMINLLRCNSTKIENC